MRELAQAHALQTFGKYEKALVGHLDDFVDYGGRADGIKVTSLRAIDAGFALRHHHDSFVFSERIDQLDGTLPAYGKGQDGVRKQDGIAHRKHGQRPYVVCFPMLRNLLGKRLLGHWLSLSVTHSSLDDTPRERFQGFPAIPHNVDSIPVAEGSHCIKGAAANAEDARSGSGKEMRANAEPEFCRSGH